MLSLASAAPSISMPSSTTGYDDALNDPAYGNSKDEKKVDVLALCERILEEKFNKQDDQIRSNLASYTLGTTATSSARHSIGNVREFAQQELPTDLPPSPRAQYVTPKAQLPDATTDYFSLEPRSLPHALPSYATLDRSLQTPEGQKHASGPFISCSLSKNAG
jgi:hypothetical protein